MADDADAPLAAAVTTPHALDALFAFHDTPEEAVSGVLDTLVGGRFAEEARALAGAVHSRAKGRTRAVRVRVSV
jgi:hypothetical protein